MSNDHPKKPSNLRIKIIILTLIFLIAVYMGMVLQLFKEPEEEVGMIVRFILFFKQNMLI